MAGGQPGEALGPFQLGSPSNYSTWERDESQTRPSLGKQGGQCQSSWEQMVGGENVTLGRKGVKKSRVQGVGRAGRRREKKISMV